MMLDVGQTFLDDAEQIRFDFPRQASLLEEVVGVELYAKAASFAKALNVTAQRKYKSKLIEQRRM